MRGQCLRMLVKKPSQTDNAFIGRSALGFPFVILLHQCGDLERLLLPCAGKCQQHGLFAEYTLALYEDSMRHTWAGLYV